jgi:hypothetical protein
LPLSTPALASYGAIIFIVAWNDLLIPLILNNRAEFMTLPVVIASLVSDLFVPQPYDGDLPDRAGAVRDPGVAAATLRRRRPLCRRNERLIHPCQCVDKSKAAGSRVSSRRLAYAVAKVA